jgi:tyrosinase
MGTATRRAAWRDGADNGWHDDLIWYAAGIHGMRQLTPGLDDFYAIFGQALPQRFPQHLVDQMVSIAVQWSDPMSLGYQSQVHGTFAAPQDWPRYKMRRVLWQECAHSQWFFLPWHRAYLVEFEAILRAHISALGGPADTWALPYWNASDWRADRRRLGLPLPLRGATLPDDVDVPGVAADADGTRPNPLFNPTRLGADEPGPNDSPAWADATISLLRPHYANKDDTEFVSFGGGVIEDPQNAADFHGDAQETGALDAQPHGTVHVHVNGTMGAFETAGLDPVFWMHHANMDRLWETYAHDLEHGYPFQDGSGAGTRERRSWTTQRFRFIQPSGSIRTWTAPSVLDIGTLGYDYDTTAPPPLPAVPPPPPAGAEIGPFGIAAEGHPAEPIAESGQVSLAQTQDVAVTAGAGAEDVAVGAFPEGAHWLLRFEGIRAARPAPTSYDVFLGLPAADAADRDDAAHYAGVLSLFGVAESSRDDGTSSGSGQRRRLDVTGQVAAQAATLRPLDTSVRLVPQESDRDLAGADLTIERITLEFV